MIEIIQHFLLQNSTILHIYKYFWSTGLHSFHSGDLCSYTHTFTHAYTHTYTHGLIIAMHTLHVNKSLTQPVPKVSSKIIPIDSCAVYSSFTMFLFVSFIIVCNPKLRAPYLSIQILPSRSAVICRRSAKITEKRMLSAVRSNLNYYGGANG